MSNLALRAPKPGKAPFSTSSQLTLCIEIELNAMLKNIKQRADRAVQWAKEPSTILTS